MHVSPPRVRACRLLILGSIVLDLTGSSMALGPPDGVGGLRSVESKAGMLGVRPGIGICRKSVNVDELTIAKSFLLL